VYGRSRSQSAHATRWSKLSLCEGKTVPLIDGVYKYHEKNRFKVSPVAMESINYDNVLRTICHMKKNYSKLSWKGEGASDDREYMVKNNN